MQIEGKVIVLDEVVVSSEKFKKRLVVIETAGEYSQELAVDFVNNNVALLDKVKLGDDVKISINIRGNEYNGKRYVNLQGYKIEDTF